MCCGLRFRSRPSFFLPPYFFVAFAFALALAFAFAVSLIRIRLRIPNLIPSDGYAHAGSAFPPIILIN